ncbi:MAG: hypothetical protein GOV15_00620 [Candidatus Diapherotrites archaeon]|nr:hypothetical protein [Candidatus Diapherotrites archaeon]
MKYRGTYSSEDSSLSNFFLTVGRLYANAVLGLEPVREIKVKDGKIYIDPSYQEKLLTFIENDIKNDLYFANQLCDKLVVKQKIFVKALEDKNQVLSTRLLRDLNSLYVLLNEYYLDLILEKKEENKSDDEISLEIPKPAPSIIQNNFLCALLNVTKKTQTTEVSKDAETRLLQIGQAISNDIYYIREAYNKVFSIKKFNLKDFSELLNGFTLHGTPVQKDFVKTTGSAIVINERMDEIWTPDQFKEKILVTEKTYVDYFPYLQEVKAIVTETGGMLSHAAIVAREQSIPVLINADNATQLILNGETLHLEGNTLTVISQPIKELE